MGVDVSNSDATDAYKRIVVKCIMFVNVVVVFVIVVLFSAMNVYPMYCRIWNYDLFSIDCAGLGAFAGRASRISNVRGGCSG